MLKYILFQHFTRFLLQYIYNASDVQNAIELWTGSSTNESIVLIDGFVHNIPRICCERFKKKPGMPHSRRKTAAGREPAKKTPVPACGTGVG